MNNYTKLSRERAALIHCVALMVEARFILFDLKEEGLFKMIRGIEGLLNNRLEAKEQEVGK